jgi:hypothetical protein
MEPIEQTAVLPDGSEAFVRVGLIHDPYIPQQEQRTVGVDVTVAGETAVSLNTILEPEQRKEARQLVEKIVSGLESGELEPTPAAIEPLADEPY